jgi:hypothetical protein
MAVPALIQAGIMATAIRSLTGELPEVSMNPEGYAELTFTAEQARNIRQYIEDRLKESGGEMAVRINANPIIIPMMIRRVAPYMLGAFALGFLISYFMKK